MTLEEAAKDLGKIIAQSNEYQNYVKSAQQARDDTELSGMLEKMRDLETKVQTAIHQGQPVDDETRKGYEQLMQDLQGKTLFQALISSQENYMKLMNNVNELISAGIEEGASSRIITNF